MNATRSYSWIIPLGGFAGFVIGLVLAAAFNASSTWERQNYPSISASADPAAELIGYADQSQLLYVKSRSQKIFQCHVAWPGEATTTVCVETRPNVAATVEDTTSCGRIFPTLQPPGNVVSALEVSPCRDDEYVQIDFVILSDNSIWRLLQGSGGAGESLAELFTLATVVIGTVLGLIIGLIISRIARHRSMT
jgi:hypothetical protein